MSHIQKIGICGPDRGGNNPLDNTNLHIVNRSLPSHKENILVSYYGSRSEQFALRKPCRDKLEEDLFQKMRRWSQQLFSYATTRTNWLETLAISIEAWQAAECAGRNKSKQEKRKVRPYGLLLLETNLQHLVSPRTAIYSEPVVLLGYISSTQATFQRRLTLLQID